MWFIHLLFYIYAVLAVISGLMVITARQPVNSVLSLVLTFFASAGIWMLLHAEFLAIILLLVYVGAVMTLFLFVVMMLNPEVERRKTGFVRYLPFGIVLVLLITALTMSALVPHYFGVNVMPPPALAAQGVSNVTLLGNELFSTAVYPFEIAGVILLTAMIAAIALAHQAPRRRKVQVVDKQIAVQPQDRVKLV